MNNWSNHFYSDIQWKELYVSTTAMNINQIDLRQPYDFRSGISDVMSKLYSWMIKLDVPLADIIFMGFNVQKFDIPMLKNQWEKYIGPWKFTYRAIDLNSVIAFVASHTNKEFLTLKKDIENSYVGSYMYESLKQLSVPTTEHHALRDAYYNIFVWEECQKIMREYNE